MNCHFSRSKKVEHWQIPWVQPFNYIWTVFLWVPRHLKKYSSEALYIQLIHEQHGFEWYVSTYMQIFSTVNTALLHNLPHGCTHGFRMLHMAKPWRQRAGSKLYSDCQLCWALNNSKLLHYFKGQLQLLHRNIFGFWKEILEGDLLLKLARYGKFERINFLILCLKTKFSS